MDYRWAQVQHQAGTPHFTVACLRCTTRLQSDRQTIWADLNGSAFVAYYCDPCKRMIDGAKR